MGGFIQTTPPRGTTGGYGHKTTVGGNAHTLMYRAPEWDLSAPMGSGRWNNMASARTSPHRLIRARAIAVCVLTGEVK